MMMGERQVDQSALFYKFSVEKHVPADHMLRAIDRFVDLGEVRPHLAPFYSTTGRPSVDPELLIRMLIIGYCYGIRSERRLCEEVHLNLGYRWFCRLGLAGEVPDHSTFSKNRHGRFRESGLLRQVFETVLRRCIEEGLVGGDGFAVDDSLIKADASRQKGVEGAKGLAPEVASRAVDEYLAVLDDAAFGAATDVTPKFISPADPAARWTGAHGGQAFFAYAANYLVDEHGIEPHVTVFDKSARRDGTFAREDFAYDRERDVYVCPPGKTLTTRGTLVNDGATLLYRASKFDCDVCTLKSRCCPKEPARKVPRSLFEGARDMARRIGQSDAGRASRRQRKKVEMLFAHLKRILRLDRLRLRGPCGARDEFLMAPSVQNLRKLAKLIPAPMP